MAKVRHRIITSSFLFSVSILLSLAQAQDIQPNGLGISRTATSTPFVNPNKPTNKKGRDTVHIGLSRVMHRDSLVVFLRTNKIKPTAFFYSLYGVGGTVREYVSVEGLEYEELVERALAKIIEHKKSSEVGEILMARRFIKDYSLEQFLNNEDLQGTARYRIYNRSRRLTTISDIAKGVPVIYGIEVMAENKKRESLYRKGEVRALFSKKIAMEYRKAKVLKTSTKGLDRMKYFEPIEPEQLKKTSKYNDNEIDSISPKEVYERLTELAKLPILADNKNE